ncbi:MAG TPA: S1 RNA-binding domain-containing protein [Myxococcaceae bacterium]|nr:S1 RNA-binding domain-containing protein [Myxococcaceae bacterium]
MSDEKSGFGGKGGGPKKPAATFGDVMLGIPSGARDRDGGRPKRDRPDRGGGGGGRRDDRGGRKGEEAAAAPPVEGGAPTAEGAKPERGGKGRGERRDRPPRKPQGPLVVVKRASGVVETRPLGEAPEIPGAPAPGAEGAAAETAATANGEAASGAAPVEPRPVEPKPIPVPRGPSVSDEVPESQSFAEMFEAQAKEGGASRKQVRVGEKVKGKIFQLGADTAFVSLGGRSEAMIELRELKDEEGILRSGVGDEIEAHVIEAGAKGIYLSKTLSKGTASMAMLAEARASGIPVEGLVLSVNKGGLEVAVGDVRAFCPVSQIDAKFVEKPDQFIGERLKFRVMEIRDRGGVVVSRRAILEEEQKALAAETRKKLQPGYVAKGKVTSVRDFGVFVDLGGVEGMIPIGELSHARVEHPSEVVKVGDEVEVEILKIDAPNPNSPDKGKQRERISLSMRSRLEDPWKAAVEEIKEGQKLTGKIVRLQPFGAFVELRPGVDGLIHISALSNRRIAHPRDVVRVGQEVQVTVEKVDPAEKRIALRLVLPEGEEAAAPVMEVKRAEAPAPRAEQPQAPRPRVGQVVMGKVDRIEPYGVFVQFPGGKGLVPASETGTERGTDLKRHFPMGTEVKVEVLEIDASGKIRLSITAAQRSEERAEMDAYRKTQQPKGGGKKGFGTFADLLKGKNPLGDKQ